MKAFVRLFFGCITMLLSIGVVAQNVDVVPVTQQAGINFNDSTQKIHIGKINITGNKKTKLYIIEREIQVKPGDSIKATQLQFMLQQAQQQVYNTALFIDVKIAPVFINTSTIHLNVIVKERLYSLPIPQFQLIDRNINEWLETYNANLSRVIYGMKFIHSNLSGRRDPLRITLLNGATRTIAVSYTQPYSNVKLTRGFGFSASYSANKFFGYKTSTDNKLLFFNNNQYARTTAFVNANYLVRNKMLDRHIFNLTYTFLKVSDSLLATQYNPTYLKTPTNKISFIDLSYTYQYVNANNAAYPLKGAIVAATLSNRGLGMSSGLNRLMLEANWGKYFAHKKNWYTSIETMGKLMLPFDQPYYNQRALGYGDVYLRGLEKYVIDGPLFFAAKSTLKKKLCYLKIPLPFHSISYPFIPITIFAKSFFDGGYVYSLAKDNTQLNNRFLYTAGLGVDFLTFYDINLRIEYSFNQLGEKGIFLHAKAGL
jgi:outer membrane protein assembly factor BamA